MKIDLEHAAQLMAQLGNETRLRIVRLLVEAGTEGLPVGRIQQKLGVPASTLSHHVNHLRGAGLVTQTRNGATLTCRVDFARLDAMIGFLTRHCCATERKQDRKRQAA